MELLTHVIRIDNDDSDARHLEAEAPSSTSGSTTPLSRSAG
jgi:hypothetical protein